MVIKAYAGNFKLKDASRESLFLLLFDMSVSTLFSRQKCRSDGDNINFPIPRNKAENQWYQNYAAKFEKPGYWLGINDADVEGEWRTDNGDLQTYFNWLSGQPNNHSRIQHYVVVAGADGRWNDAGPDDTWASVNVLCTYIVEGTAP